MNAFVTLHIGRGKTGTTALQKFLSTNRPLLERQGVYYPHAGDAASHPHPDSAGHQEFAKACMAELPAGMVPSMNPAILAETAAELRQSGLRQFLFSSENLTLANPEVVKSFFTDVLGPSRFRIVFYARSQDELAESQYSQDVKYGGEVLDFRAFVTSHLDEVEFDRTLEPWERVFGRDSIVARIYDAGSRGLIADFFAALDLELGGAQEVRASTNESLGFMAVEVLRRLNVHKLRGNRMLFDSMQAFLRAHDRPALYFSPEEARAFRERFAESNARFTLRYMGSRDRTSAAGAIPTLTG